MDIIPIIVNRLKAKFLVLAIVLFSVGCAESQTTEFKTSDKFSLLWEITGNGLQKPSYLYGTIHIYDSTIFRIPKETYAAIELCDGFALEIDLNNVDQSMLLSRMMIDNPDSTLDKLLEPEVYNEIQNIPFIKMMGAGVNMIKPFYLQQYLLVENPLAVQSVDLDLNAHAKAKAKNILGIETIETQLDMVDAVSLSEQAQGIKDIYEYCKRENIPFAEAGKKMFSILQDTYKNQDFDKLVNLDEEFKMTSSSPVSDSAIIGTRNIGMADKISDLILQQDKTLFVAVGALHLPDYKQFGGVVALLKKKGYDLRPILIDLEIH
jgi:uncharacterized protein YbaP (TraB family)